MAKEAVGARALDLPPRGRNKTTDFLGMALQNFLELEDFSDQTFDFSLFIIEVLVDYH